MNIELEEVVQDVSDEALELAAGGAQGGWTAQCCGMFADTMQPTTHNGGCVLAIADR